jgi:2-hydroxy-3-keto-5-methylthiopentenyl-1-phosphate phosphatase
MNKTLVKIAIAYDFDGTLAPGNMQEHSFLPKLGINKEQFWKTAGVMAKEQDMDYILAYMKLMLQKAEEKHIPVTRRAFLEHGKGIRFFNGLDSFFGRINQYASEKGAQIEHHIISSGVRDIIKGTSIAGNFKNIFASGFVFDANDVAIWPALAINYTNKTQYLFRINKGIDNSYDNTLINKWVEHDKRPIPFQRMIYLGDGETDVPAMKMIPISLIRKANHPQNKSARNSSFKTVPIILLRLITPKILNSTNSLPFWLIRSSMKND